MARLRSPCLLFFSGFKKDALHPSTKVDCFLASEIKKIATYGGIGIGIILLIILAIFLITKSMGKRKPSKETPLIVQQQSQSAQQPQSQEMIQQKPMEEQTK